MSEKDPWVSVYNVGVSVPMMCFRVHPMQVCAMKTKTKTKRLKLIRRRCCHRSDQCSNAPARPARLATSGSGHDHPPQSGLRRPVRFARAPDARGAGAVASWLLMLPAWDSRSRHP